VLTSTATLELDHVLTRLMRWSANEIVVSRAGYECLVGAVQATYLQHPVAQGQPQAADAQVRDGGGGGDCHLWRLSDPTSCAGAGAGGPYAEGNAGREPQGRARTLDCSPAFIMLTAQCQGLADEARPALNKISS